LLERSITLLSAFGVQQKIVLGKPDHPLGIADPKPGAGPAANIEAWINDHYRQASGTESLGAPMRLVILPVDMPLLGVKHLQKLDAHDRGAYFDDLYLPLIATVDRSLCCGAVRMKDLLKALAIPAAPVPAPWREALANVNTAADLAAIKTS